MRATCFNMLSVFAPVIVQSSSVFVMGLDRLSAKDMARRVPVSRRRLYASHELLLYSISMFVEGFGKIV